MVDGFLRSVPSDANRSDGRLYDPTVPDSGGAPITCLDAGGIAGGRAFGAPDVDLAAELAGGLSTGASVPAPQVDLAGDAAGAVGSGLGFGAPDVALAVVLADGVPSGAAYGVPTAEPSGAVHGPLPSGGGGWGGIGIPTWSPPRGPALVATRAGAVRSHRAYGVPRVRVGPARPSARELEEAALAEEDLELVLLCLAAP